MLPVGTGVLEDRTFAEVDSMTAEPLTSTKTEATKYCYLNPNPWCNNTVLSTVICFEEVWDNH